MFFWLAVMVSATLLAHAQEGGKPKYAVSGEKVTYTRTLTPVPAGTIVVKKPSSSPVRKRSAPPEHSAQEATSTSSSEIPAWRRAQEENRRRLGLLERGQSDMQSDITDLQKSQQRVEVRLDRVETKIDILSDKLSNAQLLQRSTEHSSENDTSEEKKTSFDLSRHERNQKRFVRGALIVVGAAVLTTAGYFIGKGMRDRNMANQPYNPPNPNPTPTPTPTPNTNGNPAGVPTIW